LLPDWDIFIGAWRCCLRRIVPSGGDTVEPDFLANYPQISLAAENHCSQLSQIVEACEHQPRMERAGTQNVSNCCGLASVALPSLRAALHCADRKSHNGRS